MTRRGDRYSVPAVARNRAPAAALILAALTLGGCSAVGPFAELDRGPRLAVTSGNAQVVKAGLTATDSVATSDWDAVRRTIAASPTDVHGRYDWSNPQTGSTGSVTVLALAENAGGCRPFSTTVNDARGIRHYRGDACQVAGGAWQLKRLAADDAKLL